MNIKVTSEFKPPVFIIDTNIGSPSTVITRLTIRVIMAVFKNYAVPNFLATLISYSVLVECYSNSANFLIIRANALFMIDIKTEATTPKIVMISASVLVVVSDD